MEPEPCQVRSFLIDELRMDIVGPLEINEEITDPPLTQYLAGILYPAETITNPEQDDDSNEASDEEEGVDTGTLIATATNPSSIGLTFEVDRNAVTQIAIKAARYEPHPDPSGPRRTIWKRTALDVDPLTFEIDQPIVKRFATFQADSPLGPVTWAEIDSQKKDVLGLQLYIRVRDRAEYVVVTVALINTQRVAQGRENYDASCFFQPQIEIRSANTEERIFHARTGNQIAGHDPDRELNALLYRHALEFGVGHGCAIEWEPKAEERAAILRTVIVPTYELPQISADFDVSAAAQSMQFLEEADAQDLIDRLKDFVHQYRLWIQYTTLEIERLPEKFRSLAGENMSHCSETVDRMERSIRLIKSEPNVQEAFRLANRAMRVQRSRVEWLKIPADIRPPTSDMSGGYHWRPFQLAFILQCLSSIADPADTARSDVDLLWFPTGGGKTEAYLGLSAFTIFLRRLKSNNDESMARGVTVLMRYTLRLLTIQQFQRAASLIMACEVIRRSDEKRFGKGAITLGLWVGGGATPNTRKDARVALEALLRGEHVFEGNPYQILACPWCGATLTPRHYSVATAMIIQCPNLKCEFHRGLPLYLVDEDIYEARPTMLIGTVDKFARLPWKAEVSNLFGRSGRRSLPPELIIQDELHLISGPLGTLTGLYETAIDALCQNGEFLPKVIASTATIRRAREQCLGLFGRGLRQFPPPGIDARDSFYARQLSLEKQPGRIYIGVNTPGKSMKTALLRLYARLLQGISEHRSRPEVRDPYWTLVGYFNSLRELGGAVRLVDDDVRARMRVIAGRSNSPQREIVHNLELTSRIDSDEIPRILEQMTLPVGQDGVLDVLLATNMISVGVDVDRLGLMVVTGQPKMSSEYIQATSRIGRRYPGLVVTLYNWTRPRDRSHYERFENYHAAIYSHVEPVSVTPFASRARDRALHAVLIAIMRHLNPDMNPEDAAWKFDPAAAMTLQAIEIIRARVAAVDPTEEADTLRQLTSICERWTILTKGGRLKYGLDWKHPELPHLLESAEYYLHSEQQEAFSTLNSLRDVEGSADLFRAPRPRKKD